MGKAEHDYDEALGGQTDADGHLTPAAMAERARLGAQIEATPRYQERLAAAIERDQDGGQ